MNPLLWWIILNLVILPLRSTQVVSKYKNIWLEEGSPLRVITLKQVQKLENLYASAAQDNRSRLVEFFMAMTYGDEKLQLLLTRLFNQGFSRVMVFPLYPQYSATSTGAIYDQVAKHHLGNRNFPDIRVVKNYHRNENYIAALAQSVNDHWRVNPRAEILLMSYHGIPEADCQAGDPYRIHCEETSELLALELGLQRDKWLMTFQSRVGREKWLQPYTSEAVKNLAKQGVKSIDIMCPGFSADCLETLEEIEVENRDFFIHAGGESFQYIEALNHKDAHIVMMKNIVERYLHHW